MVQQIKVWDIFLDRSRETPRIVSALTQQKETIQEVCNMVQQQIIDNVSLIEINKRLNSCHWEEIHNIVGYFSMSTLLPMIIFVYFTE